MTLRIVCVLQQACFCGSENCRGIIGGKNNRRNGQLLDKSGRQVGRPAKDKRKSNKRLKKLREKVRACCSRCAIDKVNLCAKRREWNVLVECEQS